MGTCKELKMLMLMKLTMKFKILTDKLQKIVFVLAYNFQVLPHILLGFYMLRNADACI